MTDQTPDAARLSEPRDEKPRFVITDEMISSAAQRIAEQLKDRADAYRKPTVQVDIAPDITDVMLAAAIKRAAELLGLIAPVAEQLTAPTPEHYPAILPDWSGQPELWAHRVEGEHRRMDLVGIEPVLYWHPVAGRGPGAFVAVVGLDDQVQVRGGALYVTPQATCGGGPGALAGLRVIRHDRDRRVAVVAHDGIEGATEDTPHGYITDAVPLDETMPTSDDARAAARVFAQRDQ